MRLDLGPHNSLSQIKGGRYTLITPGNEPFTARIVAEVPDIDVALKIVELWNASNGPSKPDSAGGQSGNKGPSTACAVSCATCPKNTGSGC